MKPFLKWAGGKQWLARTGYVSPPRHHRYVEPFLGGGAIFFENLPPEALLADANPDLIELFQVVRDAPQEFATLMHQHQREHSKEYFYFIRESEPPDAKTRAARFLYLNRTCWNGLYRVNRNGKFNVPIGTKSSVVFEGEDFFTYSEVLRNADLRCADFESTMDECSFGDFVFVDPPYTVKHNMNGFVRYNENIFSWNDQVRLCHSIIRAQKRGAKVVVSNADHPSIHNLYGGHSEKVTLGRSSVLSGKNEYRRAITECLYVFEPEGSEQLGSSTSVAGTPDGF